MQVRATARSVDGSLARINAQKGKTVNEDYSKKGNKNNDGHHKTHTFSMKLLRQTERIAVSVIQSSAQRRLPPSRLSWRPSGSPFVGGGGRGRKAGAARWAGPVGGAEAPAGGWAVGRGALRPGLLKRGESGPDPALREAGPVCGASLEGGGSCGRRSGEH